jgi:hypothetical protein
MIRYFYTDPLAAAWMHKHFGFKYYPQRVDVGKPTDYQYGIERLPDIFNDGYKSFIHPDYFHLLEPQESDGVEFDQWFFGRTRHQDLKDKPYQAHYGRITMALVGFQGRGCADGVQPDFCHPLFLEALLFQWPSK